MKLENVLSVVGLSSAAFVGSAKPRRWSPCHKRCLLFVLASLSVSVSVAVDVTAGEEVTLVASPESGQAFHHWSGTPAPTGEAAFQSTWTYTPTKSGTVTPVYGTLVEVASGDDLAAAITSAGEYGVVRAAAGAYTLTDQLTVGTVRLEGAGRTGASVSTIRQTVAQNRCLYLNNAYAYVSGFVVTGATGNKVPNGPGAYIDSNGGTIVDCRLTENAATAAHIYGGGVYCKGAAGLVARCVIDGNNLKYGTMSSNGHGGGVFLSAGALENCLIYGNISSHDAGGVYVEGGTVRNCTIVDNFCLGAGGLSMKNKVNVYNCALYDNVGWFGASDGGNAWYCITVANSNKFDHCASSQPIGQTGLVAQPDFVDAASRDYSLKAGSALVDAGGDAGTFVSLPLDLDRHPRSSGASLDVGCCEFQQSQPTLGLRAEPREALVGAGVRFVPTLRGGLEASTYAWTVKDSSGATVKTFSGEAPDPVSFDTPGAYTVELSAGGKTASLPAYLTVGARTNVVSTLTGAAIQAAIDAAVSGATVLLEDGTYSIATTLTIYKGITLCSRNGAEKTILKVPTGKSYNLRVLAVSHPDARVTGVTMTGGHDNSRAYIGSVVGCGGGLLEHCIVSNNYDSAFHCHGAGLVVWGKKAVVRSTLIAGNKLTQSKNCYGGGVYLACGTVENCLIRDNRAYQYGGGVYVAGSNARLVNCSLVDNTTYGQNVSPNAGGGVYVAKSLSSVEIVNCAFANNHCDLGTGDGEPDWFCGDTAGKTFFANCAVSSVAPNVHCFVPDGGDFKFMDAPAGDYRLNTLSPLVDAGDDTVVSSAVTKDFGGVNNRILGDHVDIGCYEADVATFVCSADVAPRTALEGSRIVFTASTNGAPSDAVYSWTLRRGETPVAIADNARMAVTNVIETPGWYTVRLDVSFGGTDYFDERTNILYVGMHTNYVVATWDAGHVPVYPHATWATASTNLFEAVDEALDGTVVVLGEGRYVTARTLVVDKGITLTSLAGTVATEISATGNVGQSDESLFYRTIKINHADAVVEKVTVSCGRARDTGVGGGGVLIAGNGGTLRDCLVERNGPMGQHTPGAGVTIQGAGGLVDRCVLRYNNGVGSGSCGGGGAHLMGGTLRNTLVYGNRSRSGAGVYVRDGSPVIDNCTVVSNICDGTDTWELAKGGALTCEKAATIRNVVSCFNEDTVHGLTGAEKNIRIYAKSDNPDAVSNAMTIANCAFTVPLGTDGVVAEGRLFRRFDPSAGKFDFRPARDSALVGNGAELDWMTEGAQDVFGNSRIRHGVPDIGAAEGYFPGLLLLVR